MPHHPLENEDELHRRFRSSSTIEFLKAEEFLHESARQKFVDLEKQKIVSYNPTSWYGTLCICRGRTPLGSLWWAICIISLVYTICMKFAQVEYTLSPLGHTLTGSALMFLTVLRTVNSVRKYWDAVDSWMGVSASCRDCASQVAHYITHDGIRARALKFSIVYCVAMRSYLRKEKIVAEEVSGILSSQEVDEINNNESPPVYCIQAIRQCLAIAVTKKMCLPFHMSIEKSLFNMNNHFAHCQKLLYPMPIAYIAHLRTFTIFWLLTVIPLVYQSFGWITALVVSAISYTLVGLENTAVQMEDPFGYDANDIPLDSVCAEIQHSILKIIDGQLQFEQEFTTPSKEEFTKEELQDPTMNGAPKTCIGEDASVTHPAKAADVILTPIDVPGPVGASGTLSTILIKMSGIDQDVKEMTEDITQDEEDHDDSDFDDDDDDDGDDD